MQWNRVIDCAVECFNLYDVILIFQKLLCHKRYNEWVIAFTVLAICLLYLTQHTVNNIPLDTCSKECPHGGSVENNGYVERYFPSEESSDVGGSEPGSVGKDGYMERYSPTWRCHLKPSVVNKTFQNTDITDKDNLNKTQKLSCNGCFPSGFKYLNQPIGVCDVFTGQKVDDLVVVILILSAPKDFVGREQIRHSWAGATRANTAPNVRYLFLLGRASSSQEQRRIDSEQALYNDILQKNIPEGYLLMGVKTVMGLEWTTTKCSRARYILKTDIDSFINVAALMSAIASVGPEVGLFGYCDYDGIPIRDP